MLKPRKSRANELYVHHLPGRLRIKCPLLKHDDGRAERVERAMEALAGVERCTVNTLTGSVLCHYAVSATEAEDLMAALRRSLPDPASAARRPPEPPALRRLEAPASLPARRDPYGPPGGRIHEKVMSILFEKAMERALVLLVRAVF